MLPNAVIFSYIFWLSLADAIYSKNTYGVFSDLTIMGERFLSVKSQSQRSSIIVAKWYGANGQIDTSESSKYRYGEVQHFIQHMTSPETKTLQIY